MSYAVLDCETSVRNRGHVYDPANELVVTGVLSDGAYSEYWAEDSGEEIKRVISGPELLVLFNAKFDLSWLRRKYGVYPHKQIWDCQVAEYCYSGQKLLYPSLNQCCERYGLPQKLDVVKTEYWDKGIDTKDIPVHILSEYLEQDVRLTEALYLKQKDHPQARLVRQMCFDLLALGEMEWNGMLYDKEASVKAADGLKERIDAIEAALDKELGATINWGSPKQVAAVLFGGVIEEEYREEYLFHYAGGKKPPVMKTRKGIREVVFPKLIESQKETPGGEPSVDAEVLKKIPRKGKAGRIAQLLTDRAGINKLEGTYFRGIPKIMDEMGWQDNLVHGALNQVSTVTGRLSAVKPNRQNEPSEAKQFFLSRFA